MLAIVQVAIGLIFLFSLLSILVTTVNSVVANILKTRTKHLKLGITSLITDPELLAQFLSHPLVKLVKTPMVMPGYVASAAEAQAVADQVQRADLTQLTWIEPKLFAEVLSSLLTEKAELSLYGPLLMTVDALPESQQKERVIDLVFGLESTGIGLNDLRAAIYELPADYQPHLFEALEPIEARLKEMQENSDSSRLLPLLEGVRKVNDDAFQRAMKVIVGSAKSLEEAQHKIEFWFNARMDQLSDKFKRTMTLYSIIIGAVLALVLNVDTLHTAQSLWTEPSLRAAISTAAQEAVQSGSLQDQINQSQANATAANDQNTPPSLNAVATFESTLNDLLELNLPIGWGYAPVEGGCFRPAGETVPSACSSPLNLWAFVPGNSPDWFGLVVRKVIGIVVTIVAIAQGAPFWFDLLNRLVRGGG